MEKLKNIPIEIKAHNQWVVWRYEERDGSKPTKVPYNPNNGRLASVNNHATWASYDQAFHAFANSSGFYSGVGFVLTATDPFAFIDLDEAKNEEEHNNQLAVFDNFVSYAEKSPSGKGLHIIVKGNLKSGCKRSGVELYSSARFMTMTGNVYRNEPIRDYTTEINNLWDKLNEDNKAKQVYCGNAEAKLTDEQVIDYATNAANSEKFSDLYYDGNWQKYYASQSEADFALFDIIAFYSENGQQTQRIFLQSKLAEREKSRAQYRINYMLNRCFDRMLPPIDFTALKEQIENSLKKPTVNLPSEENYLPTNDFEVQNVVCNVSNPVYSVPPGLVGDITKFIYAQAPRPVTEIALAGALAMMSGIAGRSYNISGTGLNHYIMLLAGTGTGKEAVAKGVNRLISVISETVPAAIDFVGPGEIASAQAITKFMGDGRASFVTIVGEFGLYLQQMAGPNAAPHLAGLRRFMLDVYNKSGESDMVRPSIYSDKIKNTGILHSPNFSLLGESTPEKYYEGLHEGLILEGLLPRFTTIEYRGKRVPYNENHKHAKPSFDLIEKLSSLCAHSLMLNSQNKAINVMLDRDAEIIFKNYDKHCDLQINSSEKEAKKQLWSRGHMKALKLAGLIAVGCNTYDPVVTAEIANWAINMISTDIKFLSEKFEAGEIGIDNDESNQLNKIYRTAEEYLKQPWSACEKYAGKNLQNLHSEKVIPYSFFQRKLSSIAIFRKDRIGASNALKRAIQTAIERGDLQEISKGQLWEKFKSNAKAYAISNPDAFDF